MIRANTNPRTQHAPKRKGRRGKQVRLGDSLAMVQAKIASEWHPTMNGAMRPENVGPGSHETVCWRCPKGHDWRGVVRNQRGRTVPLSVILLWQLKSRRP